MALQAFVFGSVIASQQVGVFPSVTVGPIRLRIEEVLIAGGVVAWLVTMLLRPYPWRSAVRGTPTWLIVVIAWTTLTTVLSIGRGAVQNGSQAFGEARLVLMPALYFALALFWLPHLRLVRLIRRIEVLLIPFIVGVILDFVVSFHDWMGAVVGLFGGVHGGLSMSIMSLLIFALALRAGHVVYGSGKAIRHWVWVMLITGGVAATVNKPGWLLAASVLTFTVLVVLMRVRHRHHHAALLRALVLSFTGVFVALAAVLFVYVVFPSHMAEYVDAARVRLLRPDAGGDVSGGRIILFAMGLARFAQAPVTGAGFGGWHEIRLDASNVMLAPDHFFPLWVAIRGGVLMLVPVLILTVWYIGKGYRNCWQIKQPKLLAVVVGCYVFTLAQMTYGLIGVPVLLFDMQILFWLSVAIVLRAPSHCDNGRALAIPAGVKRSPRMRERAK
jgi:hypothetical protein